MQAALPRRRLEWGFTLIEVLMSAAIVGVVAVSLLAGFSSSLTLLRLAREDQRASQILARKIEEVRLCTWSQLANLPATFSENLDPFASGSSPGLVFAGRIEALATPAVPDSASYQNDLRLINVTVY